MQLKKINLQIEAFSAVIRALRAQKFVKGIEDKKKFYLNSGESSKERSTPQMRQPGFDRPTTTTLASQFSTPQTQHYGVPVSQQQQMGPSSQHFQSGNPMQSVYPSSLVSQGPQSMQPGQPMPTQFQYPSSYTQVYGSPYGPQFSSMPSAGQYPTIRYVCCLGLIFACHVVTF